MAKITEIELRAAMVAAGASSREVEAEFNLLGLDNLLAWANDEPDCADPCSDGGWDWTFTEEVWDALWGSPDER